MAVYNPKTSRENVTIRYAFFTAMVAAACFVVYAPPVTATGRMLLVDDVGNQARTSDPVGLSNTTTPSPRPPPSSDSSLPPPPPESLVKGYNTSCPGLPVCGPGKCPNKRGLKILLTNPASYPSVVRGRLYPIHTGAEGNTILKELGYISIENCCKSCQKNYRAGCAFWAWSMAPTKGLRDRGRCRLFKDQACVFMTEDGLKRANVFDPTKINDFLFPMPCIKE